MKAWAWRIAYAVVATLMVANAVALSVAIYWSVEADIVDLDYAHPALLTIPASNREDARANQTTVTRAGQTLYFYAEYCVSKSVAGRVHQSWVDGVVFNAPVTSTVSQVGCFKRSFAVYVPTEVRGKTVTYVRVSTNRVNPIVDQVVRSANITIDVLP